IPQRGGLRHSGQPRQDVRKEPHLPPRSCPRLGRTSGMSTTRRWRRALASWLLLASVAASSGCIAQINALTRPEEELKAPCQALPSCCRDHVYIFLVNGLDPINASNMAGLRDYLQDLGFNKTYYGQLYHSAFYNKEIRRIHESDPDA